MFHRSIHPSIISRVLKAAPVEFTPTSSSAAKRVRTAAWPELEEALLSWIQRTEVDLVITGDLLRIKATQFWEQLPQYSNSPLPQWSNGWLCKFIKRQGLQTRRRHGEASSVDAEMARSQLVSQLSP